MFQFINSWNQRRIERKIRNKNVSENLALDIACRSFHTDYDMKVELFGRLVSNSTIEELETSNEKLQDANEESLSSNEELQSS